jgi:hypothetical protein
MILSTLKTLALGIWLGALVMLGFAVAGPIFQQLPSKTLAGAINGVILGRMNTIEWGCAIFAFACSVSALAFHWNDRFRTLRIIELASILVMIVLLSIYSISITSRMQTLRATIGDFDHPRETPEYVQAKSEFDDLHHRYTALVGTNMIILLGAFTLSMMNSRKSD